MLSCGHWICVYSPSTRSPFSHPFVTTPVGAAESVRVRVAQNRLRYRREHVLKFMSDNCRLWTADKAETVFIEAAVS